MKEIYTLMDCKPGRLYKRTYVELHHSDSEEKNKNESLGENENWFNSIICVESHFDKETQMICLRYKAQHTFVSNKLILQPSLTFKSAHSEILKQILNYLKVIW